MQSKAIPVRLIRANSHRLDVPPYLSGALEAKEKLQALTGRLARLSELTTGHLGGIYRPYVFISKQIWVQSREHGVPFLTGSTMIRSDLTSVRLLAKRQAMSRTFRPLEIHPGTTLVSCSGNIGRTIFVRPDMDGMWTSLDLMKIIPDASKIRPGYLFAYLAGRFGLPLLTESTYGAIIQHVDREHLLDLPVPRLGEALEKRAHDLVDRAARLRATAAAALAEAGKRVCDLFRFPHRVALAAREFGTSAVGARSLQGRMDATYFSRAALASGEVLRAAGARASLEDLGVRVLETGRIKQFFVAESAGVPFLTSGEIFLETYNPERFLSRKRLQGDWPVATEDTLLARSGQVGGIIGRGVWADARFANSCVSVDVVRIRSSSTIDAAFLHAFLCLTDVGYHQLIRTAAGSSIPHLGAKDILAIRLPTCDIDTQRTIGALVRNAGDSRRQAQSLEGEAIQCVESAIDKGAA